MEGNLEITQNNGGSCLRSASLTDGSNILQLDTSDDLLQFISLGDNTFTNLSVEDVKDPESFNLLDSWGFGDLYTEFVDQQISVEVLKVLIEKDIDEIFANKNRRLKYVFRHKLVTWRSENGIPTPLACETDVSSLRIESAVSSWLDKNLNSFIETNSSGGSSQRSSPPSEEFSYVINGSKKLYFIYKIDIFDGPPVATYVVNDALNKKLWCERNTSKHC